MIDFISIAEVPEAIRQSAVKDATCERKYYLKHMLKVSLRGGERKESADLGTIYHRFQHVGEGHDIEVMNWVRGLQAELMKKVNRGDDLDGNLIATANSLTELYYKARAMAYIFWEKFPLPEYLVPIAKEQPIQYFDNVLEVELSGTLDLILMDIRDNTYWIRDHKSTSRPLNAIFASAGWGIQSRIYRLLGLEYLKQNGLSRKTSDLKGFILDGIQFPGIKQCKKDEKEAKDQGISVEDAYLRRVRGWYGEKRDKEEDEVIRSKAIFYAETRYPNELVTSIVRIKKLHCRKPVPWEFSRDITGGECFSYNRLCPFYDLCNTPPGLWDSLFERKYKFQDVIQEKETHNDDTE